MKLAVVCRSCNGDDERECGCRRSLSRFFELLSIAEQRRVSTLKVTSTDENKTEGSGCVDKLTFRLESPLSVSELKQRSEAVGLSQKIVKLRDRRSYLLIGDKNGGWYFQLPHHEAPPFTTTMITRPSAFKSFETYRQCLLQILTLQELDALRITRLDLAVDYSESFESILQSVDVTHKQLRVKFTDKGNKRTGMMIGQGNEKLVIYDKGHEQKSNTVRTRLELQLTGAKLPARDLDSLRKTILAHDLKRRPFERVTLFEIKIRNTPALSSPLALERLRDLQVLFKREGFLATRKRLSENGNFDRDYGPLFELVPRAEQPDKTLARSLEAFFGGAKSARASGLKLVTIET